LDWGFGSLFLNSLMHCLAERPPPQKKKIIGIFVDNFRDFENIENISVSWHHHRVKGENRGREKKCDILKMF
jgi:hypothetical protein